MEVTISCPGRRGPVAAGSGAKRERSAGDAGAASRRMKDPGEDQDQAKSTQPEPIQRLPTQRLALHRFADHRLASKLAESQLWSAHRLADHRLADHRFAPQSWGVHGCPAQSAEVVHGALWRTS